MRALAAFGIRVPSEIGPCSNKELCCQASEFIELSKHASKAVEFCAAPYRMRGRKPGMLRIFGLTTTRGAFVFKRVSRMSSQPSSPQTPSGEAEDVNPVRKNRILIGSQRDPKEDPASPETGGQTDAEASGANLETPSNVPDAEVERTPADSAAPSRQGAAGVAAIAKGATPGAFPPPRIQRVTDDLQREIDMALAGLSMQDILESSTGKQAKGPEPELDKRYRGMVTKIYRDDVFVSLPGNHDGVASFRQFTKEPSVGDVLEFTVVRFNPDEGLYTLNVPGGAIQVGDWSDIEEGVVIEVRITGHNAGGLECEANNVPGFIPAGQVSLYHVDDLSQFVGERWACVVTDSNPARRNLVLSRKAYLERERQESKQQLLASLQPGQTHEGVIRSLRDFGAFVDLGGIDGLIHVSKLSWDRIRHPSEVVQEGQKVKVKIEKIDPVTGKISLSYRDLIVQPWENVEQRFPINTVVTGTISKIMDFGAFVRIESGVEGLVHISELAHHRVSRVNSMVEVGQTVQVKILSIDPESQRMSLSMKQAIKPPVEEPAEETEPEAEALRPSLVKPRNSPLKGGTNRSTGGEQFGLKW
jgi:predicted RNA-binding protein with RPS1 domain